MCSREGLVLAAPHGSYSLGRGLPRLGRRAQLVDQLTLKAMLKFTAIDGNLQGLQIYVCFLTIVLQNSSGLCGWAVLLCFGQVSTLCAEGI